MGFFSGLKKAGSVLKKPLDWVSSDSPGQKSLEMVRQDAANRGLDPNLVQARPVDWKAVLAGGAGGFMAGGPVGALAGGFLGGMAADSAASADNKAAAIRSQSHAEAQEKLAALQRDQYALRMQNLDKALQFFGPAQAQYERLYGVKTNTPQFFTPPTPNAVRMAPETPLLKR